MSNNITRKALQAVFFFVVVLCLLPLNIQGQIRAEDILDRAVLSDTLLSVQAEQLRTLRGFDIDLNLLDQIELRTEYDNFKDPRSEYTGRFSMNGIKEQDAQRALNAGRLDEVAVELLMREHEIRSDIYDDLVDWAACQEELKLMENQERLLRDEVRVLKKKLVYGAEKDYATLFKNTMDLEDLEQKRAKTKMKLQLFKAKYGQNESVDLEIESWLSIPEMLFAIKNKETFTSGHPMLLRSLARKRRIELRQNLEDAKLKKRIDFFQIRHKNRNNEGLPSNLSIGFGFVFPYSGSAKVESFELKLDALEQERELLEDTQALNDKILALQSQATVLESSYQTAQTARSAGNNDPTLQKLKLAEDIDPMILLSIEGLDMKRAERLLEIEHEVRQLYVEWLKWSGRAAILKEGTWLRG